MAYMHPQTQSTFTLKTVVTIFALAVSSIGMTNTANSAIEFTPAEQAYIVQSSGIKMCVDPDWAPFEQITPQGQHEGIAADLVRLSKTGKKAWLHPSQSAARS